MSIVIGKLFPQIFRSVMIPKLPKTIFIQTQFITLRKVQVNCSDGFTLEFREGGRAAGLKQKGITSAMKCLLAADTARAQPVDNEH